MTRARNLADETMLGSGMAAFGLQRQLAGADPGADPGANGAEIGDRTLVWSPFSVGSALGLVWAGAGGRTAEELAAAVGPGHQASELGSMAADAAGTGGTPLNGAALLAASMLWVQDTLPVRDEYRDVVRGWPGGAVRTVGFAADPATARDTVNHAVREATNDLIPELLGAGDVSAETLAVLVTAFWLRVRWDRPFEPARTRPEDFETPHGAREVPMMTDVRRLPYARIERDGQSWSLVSLSAGDVVCDLVLPDRPEARVDDPALVAELRQASRPRMVDLRLPRFRVRGRAELTEALRSRTPTVFSDAAELSGISPVALKLDAVVHEAVLGVDEIGAEAAAATAASMVLAAAVGRPEEPVAFHVRHPFLALLRHRRTGVTYALAQVTEP